MMHTEFPTSCVSFHAILKHTFAVSAFDSKPGGPTMAACCYKTVYIYQAKDTGSMAFGQLHCMPQGPVDSGDTMHPCHSAVADTQTPANCTCAALATIQHYLQP